MNSYQRTTEEMTCEAAQLLMVPVWARELGVSERQEESFSTHLNLCLACAREYEETKTLMDMLKINWGPISQKTARVLAAEDPAAPASGRQKWEERPSPVEFLQKNWRISGDMQTLTDDASPIGEKKESPKVFGHTRIAMQVASVAAAFFICLGIGLAFWANKGVHNQETVQQTFIQNQLIVPKIAITENGLAVSSSGLLTTDGTSMRELLINGRHRLVINRDTILSIDPLVKDEKLGCLIHLRSGQILAEVEHDGNPFEVLAPHGEAVITGTVFDVKVTEQETTLIVADGSVRFESSEGRVDVGAGFQSTSQAHSRPSSPTRCDAKSLLAWANGTETLAPIEKPLLDSDYAQLVETLPLPLAYPGRPIDLGLIDYEEWVASKRAWFAGQFPWIFELQEAIAMAEGYSLLAVTGAPPAHAPIPDYTELLLQTGDLWQIVYPHRFYKKIPIIRKESLTRVVRTYDLESAWLDQILSAAARRTDLSTARVFFGEEALNQWLSLAREVERDCNNPVRVDALCEYCLVNSEYVENSRILLWLCLKNGKYTVATNHETEILHRLQAQVAAAHTCKIAAWHLNQLKTRDDPTRERYYREILDAIVETIEHEKVIQALNY